MVFFVLARFVLVKYSRAFVERPSQGTSSLASRLTTVSLDQCALEMTPRTHSCEIDGFYTVALRFATDL